MTDPEDRTVVLTIDDEPIVRESIAVFLEDSGMTVIQAENGRAGLALFRQQKPDIVLVDLRMPEVDGLDVLITVTAESPETPIIVVSGTGVIHDAIEALRLGAWDYIIKPIPDMAILEHAVKKALDRAQLRVENRRYQENLEGEIKARTKELQERTQTLEMINAQLKSEMEERKKAENEVRRSQERYRALFEDSPISLWEEDLSEVKKFLDGLKDQGVTDFEDYFDHHPEDIMRCTEWIRITDVNKATVQLYEASDRTDFIGSLNRILSKKSHRILKDQLITIAQGNNFQIESVNKTFSGKTIHVIVKSSIPPGYGHTWQKVFVSVNDISERIRNEEEKRNLETRLHQAQKMEAIGTLAGGIAHDFNNILFPIIGYAEMTIDDVPNDSIAQRNIKGIIKSANRARDLVQQILSFSRKDDQELRRIRLHPIIKESLKLLRSTLPSTIEIKQKIPTDCAPVLASPVHIHQIIMNLCTNAYHAMRETGGILNVSLEEIVLNKEDVAVFPKLSPGAYLKITIRDSGCGIPADILNQIFEPYFTTKSPAEGTGLGLFVVWGIVNNYSGHISVYSDPGKGTEFIVYLPSAEVKDMGSETPGVKDPISRGTEKILLVDDEEEIVDMEKDLLERIGYHVTTATSSVEALNLFQNAPDQFDLVITDTTMPQMTGVELSKKFLEIRPDLPIILCTGFTELITEEKAKKIGIREFVMKPILITHLSKVLRSLLDKNIQPTSKSTLYSFQENPDD